VRAVDLVNRNRRVIDFMNSLSITYDLRFETFTTFNHAQFYGGRTLA
jgi:hypothetical protein